VGRTRTYLKTTTITRVVAVAGILVGLNFGLEGVAESVVVTSLISFFIYNHFVGQLIPVTNATMLRIIIKNGFPSLAMLFLIVLFRLALGDQLLPAYELGISIIIGIASYGLLIKVFHPELLMIKPI
jgi:hypothetical protein